MNNPAYELALKNWLSSAKWHYLITLTSTTHRDQYFYQSKLERLKKIFAASFKIEIEYAGSIELTKNGINHCHALVRFLNIQPGICLKGTHIVFPNDWYQRQRGAKGNFGMVRYIHRLSGFHGKSYKEMVSREATYELRNKIYSTDIWIQLWYQCNYGCILDVEIIRSQEGVISYALKYAMKAQQYQSNDWFISSGAVPSQD